jgi:hypothetical protein
MSIHNTQQYVYRTKLHLISLLLMYTGSSMFKVVLMMAAICLGQVAALTLHLPFDICISRASPSRSGSPLTCHHASPPKKSSDGSSTSKFYVYKDDCFGFATFLGGIAMQDVVFMALFVSLSLGADVLARLRVLPPDPKRASIVNRKVPGVIAVLTLTLACIGSGVVSQSELMSIEGPANVHLAREVQLLICSFSAITAFLDIRWRDRFDYGPNDQVE